MADLKEALNICGIKCKYCLDRKYLWRPRLHSLAFFDMKGGFDVIRCTKCSNGEWIRCSHRSENYEGGERLLKEDDSDAIRYSMISGRAQQILENRKKQLEIDNVKIQREQKIKEQKEEEKKKLYEEVDKQMDDGSNIPKYDNHIKNKYDSKTETSKINIEFGKMLNQVVKGMEAYGGDLLALIELVKNFKIDLTISSNKETNKQIKCTSIRNDKGQYIYFILKAESHKINSSYDCLEWCGCISSMSSINIDYTIFFPKNNKAKENCENKISEISEKILNNVDIGDI